MHSNYDEEIDLLELFDYVVIRNIKKIIVVSLIFCLIGLSYAFLLNNKETNFSKLLVQNKEEALSKYAKEISSSDIEDVETYYEDNEKYNKNEEYLNNSIKLNSIELYDYKVRYLANGTEDIYSVIPTIEKEIYSDDLIEEIANELNLNDDYKYYDTEYFVKELLSISNTERKEEDSTTSDTNVITIDFVCNDEVVADKVGDLLTERVNKIIEDKFNGADFDIEPLASYVSVLDNTLINNQITSLNDNQTALKKENDTLYAKFDYYQLAYLGYLEGSTVTASSSNRLAKYGAIGLIIGLVIVCGYYVLVFMLKGQLHGIDELMVYDIKPYGLVGKRSHKSIVKQDITSIDTIVKLIELDMHNSNNASIIIGSSLNIEDINEVVEELKKYINIKNVFDNVLDNDQFVEECKNNIPVVYIEKIEKTKLKDINRINEYNKNYLINSLGIIVINN